MTGILNDDFYNEKRRFQKKKKKKNCCWFLSWLTCFQNTSKMSVSSQSLNFSMKSQAMINELRKQKMLQDQEILLLRQLLPAQALQDICWPTSLQFL